LTTPPEISQASFALVANGFADGPAQALRDYLVERGAHVVTVFHPLTREQGNRHVVAEYRGGTQLHTRSIRVPLPVPLSYAADPLVPLRLPRVDAWFGFNPLACARGLAARRLGRASRVVLWSVDFVPGRFGRTPLTRVYDALDRLCCTQADARVELSEAARDGRNARHGLPEGRTPTHIVPMGAWLSRVPRVPEDGHERRRVVFLGHLVPRQGVGVLLDALAELRRQGVEISADVVGDGPLATSLRAHAARLHIDEIVRFHGYVEDHRQVEEILAAASVAVAPYVRSDDSFTRSADPGKLKAYLAAGLPIVMTDVPPNAKELAREAGAELVSDEPAALADVIETLLRSPESWRERRERALRYARRFDWELLFGKALADLGFELG
jgi:glycosyltransferase involved in cell wall biosynthesis